MNKAVLITLLLLLIDIAGVGVVCYVKYNNLSQESQAKVYGEAITWDTLRYQLELDRASHNQHIIDSQYEMPNHTTRLS